MISTGMTRYAVIMAGGVGARFWPASRKATPKQLLALGPEADRSLLQSTVMRLTRVLPCERILVVTGRHLAEATRQALPAVPASNVLEEPVGRNTAPCIAWATAEIRKRENDATIGVFPADHHIGDEDSFARVLEQAYKLAAGPHIVTVGIEPTRPETGYGYIEAGDALADAANAFEVKRFVEKPDRQTALRYVEAGTFYWNSGMFFFSAQAMWSALCEHVPQVAKHAQTIADAEANKTAALDAHFSQMESISIDYAVMERAKSVRVVTGDFGWSDLGSWQTAWELAPKDADNNASSGSTLFVDSRRCFVRAAPNKTVALVGCDDLVVVDTGDALLITPRERAQEVRKVVDALKANGSDLL